MLLELKCYTISKPVHGFVGNASFVGLTGGLQQFCCCSGVFMRGETPVFSVFA